LCYGRCRKWHLDCLKLIAKTAPQAFAEKTNFGRDVASFALSKRNIDCLKFIFNSYVFQTPITVGKKIRQGVMVLEVNQRLFLKYDCVNGDIILDELEDRRGYKRSNDNRVIRVLGDAKNDVRKVSDGDDKIVSQFLREIYYKRSASYTGHTRVEHDGYYLNKDHLHSHPLNKSRAFLKTSQFENIKFLNKDGIYGKESNHEKQKSENSGNNRKWWQIWK
jgi:hypothetical protein